MQEGEGWTWKRGRAFELAVDPQLELLSIAHSRYEIPRVGTDLVSRLDDYMSIRRDTAIPCEGLTSGVAVVVRMFRELIG